MNTGGLWLIWSIEHNAWWRPNSNGYTPELSDAGRYSYVEARRIVQEANEYTRHQTPNEAMVPLYDRLQAA